jgi:hypothetical protein
MRAQESFVRVSNSRSRSNPILESERAFQLGGLRRDNESRQLARLLQLQQDHVPVYRIPEFIRIDPSELKISRDRIGVVGLVVDETKLGLVTQLKVSQSACWEISVELPFRQSQIQSLLLRLISEVGIDEGLPELLAFRISDTLGEGIYGDSMDIACLLAIVDAAGNYKHDLFSAAAAVVIPLSGISLKRSESVRYKLEAFIREFGKGSLLVRMREDAEAEKFDHFFDVVWPVSDLRDLATRLDREGLIAPLNQQVSLDYSHALAISTRTQHLLSRETTYQDAKDFLRRVKGRLTSGTPLQIRLELSYAEEDLHRHLGSFDGALNARAERYDLERNPLISCYQRMADSDNRHAAALYDAHRFEEAVKCIETWYMRLKEDPRICLPETRSLLFNTLSRCLVVVGDRNWESVLAESLKIQEVVSPENLLRTKNYLIHGLLKTNRFDDALEHLGDTRISRDSYRIWLHTEYIRRTGGVSTDMQIQQIEGINDADHAYGFAMQSAARQYRRDTATRVDFLRKAGKCFLRNTDNAQYGSWPLPRGVSTLVRPLIDSDRSDSFRYSCRAPFIVVSHRGQHVPHRRVFF